MPTEIKIIGLHFSMPDYFVEDYLEMERSGVWTEIGELRKEGVIECRRGWFEVWDNT